MEISIFREENRKLCEIFVIIFFEPSEEQIIISNIIQQAKIDTKVRANYIKRYLKE